MIKLIRTAFLFSSLILLVSCSNEEIDYPETSIQTTESNIFRTFTSININGTILNPNELQVLSQGVCWSINPEPSIDDNIKIEENDIFESVIDQLVANTTYYFRVFVTTESGTTYSEEHSFSTLSLGGTSWDLTTNYEHNYIIYSKLEFMNDYSTLFNELDLPGQCASCFIKNGTWTLDGNNLTYIWEGDNPNSTTYLYEGTLTEMSLEGTYIHTTLPSNTWNAESL